MASTVMRKLNKFRRKFRKDYLGNITRKERELMVFYTLLDALPCIYIFFQFATTAIYEYF